MSRMLCCRLILLTWCAAGGLSTACRHADTPPPTAATPPAGTPRESNGLHLIDNPRLQRVMRDLQQLNLEEWERQIELGNEPTAELRTIANISALLAKDARVIPLTFGGEAMSAEQRSHFTLLARRLEDQARDLERAAEDRDPQAIQLSLAGMITTCNRCHNAFRGPLLAGWSTPSSPGRG